MSSRPTFRDKQKNNKSGEASGNTSIFGKEDYCNAAVISTTAGATPIVRLGKNQLAELNDRLTDRDFEILTTLKHAKYLIADQIRRLFITDASSKMTGMRAASRNMFKLKELGLMKTFERRIGGKLAGSASYVWALTEGGQRLLSLHNNEGYTRRGSRLIEPSYEHIRHTLTIAECYVLLTELARKNPSVSLKEVQWEPESWRPYSVSGKSRILKPDLAFVCHVNGYEDRWFVEVDMSTQSMPAIVTKSERYHQYLKTGIEQRAHHNVFPIPIWIVLDEHRKDLMMRTLKKTYKKAPHMFAVITIDELENLVLNGADPNPLY